MFDLVNMLLSATNDKKDKIQNWKDTPYLSVFSPNTGKYGPE